MKAIKEEFLPQISENFQFKGEFVGMLPYGNGHINDTFSVFYQEEEQAHRYILQRINTNVFKKPVELMENIQGVTQYLYDAISNAGGDPYRETLNLVPALDGKFYFVDEDSGYWRAFCL